MIHFVTISSDIEICAMHNTFKVTNNYLKTMRRLLLYAFTKVKDITPYFPDNNIHSGGKWNTDQNHSSPLIGRDSNLTTFRIGRRFYGHACVFSWYGGGNAVLLVYVFRTTSFRCFFSSNIGILIMTNLYTNRITRFRSISRDFVFIVIITSSCIITQAS